MIALIAAVSAQPMPRVPTAGWARVEASTAPADARAEVGVSVPLSRVTALVVDGQGGLASAGLDVGPSFQIGALDLAPMAALDYAWDGGLGVGGQVRTTLEVPPLPLYVDARVRFLARPATGNSFDDRTLILWTFAEWVAAGAEHDGLNALGGAGGFNQWGARANFGVCRPVVLGVFAGYELDEAARAATEVGPPGLAARVEGVVRF
jgi:hypothetical protein